MDGRRIKEINFLTHPCFICGSFFSLILRRPSLMRRPQLLLILVTGWVLATLASGCGGTAAAPGGPESDLVTLGAYSVVREAFHEGLLIPAFAERVAGEQTGRVGAVRRVLQRVGLAGPRDRLGLRRRRRGPLAREATWSCWSRPGWSAKDLERRGRTRGNVTHSLVVIGIREGEPPGTSSDWPDLARAGVSRALSRPQDLRRGPLEHRAPSGARGCSGGINPKARKTSPTSPPPATCSPGSRRNVLEHGQLGPAEPGDVRAGGTSDAVVTYENELLLRRRATAASRSRTSPPPQPSGSRAPPRLVETSIAPPRQPRGRRGLLRLPHLGPRGRRSSAEFGFRPVDPTVATRPGLPPLPSRAVHDPRPRRLAEGEEDRVFDAGGVWPSIVHPIGSGRRGSRP